MPKGKNKKKKGGDIVFSIGKGDVWKVGAIVFVFLVLALFLTNTINFSSDKTDNPLDAETADTTKSQGKVTIIEYSDFQCPYCARFYRDAYSQIKQTYGDDVEFIFKHFPLDFHQYAQKAAEAAECARDQGKFWEYHDLLFENQQALDTNSLKRYAKDLGLDTVAFSSCLDSGEKEGKVKSDYSEGQAEGVSGTPTFLIGSQQLVGAQPFQAFKEIIDKALSEGGITPLADVNPSNSDPPIKLTVLNDRECDICDTSRLIQATKNQLFPTVVIEEIDISSSRGLQLIEEFDIKAIPAYIFDDNIEGAVNFPQVEGALVKVGSNYIILPSSSGAAKYLKPPGVDDDPVKGDKDAPVTIIEFSDFECPFCARFYSQTLPLIEEEYIKTGKVKLVFRDFPLEIHSNAQKAAEAAECADDQGKFWPYHDILFENQDNLGAASLKEYAGGLGLDVKAFNECLDSGKYAEEVNADFEDGQIFGVSGTPAFFINNMLVSGAQPYENFRTIIESELKKVS